VWLNVYPAIDDYLFNTPKGKHKVPFVARYCHDVTVDGLQEWKREKPPVLMPGAFYNHWKDHQPIS